MVRTLKITNNLLFIFLLRVGGPNVVYAMMAIEGVTKISENIYGINAKLAQSIIGLDATGAKIFYYFLFIFFLFFLFSALYTYCMSQQLPSG